MFKNPPRQTYPAQGHRLRCDYLFHTFKWTVNWCIYLCGGVCSGFNMSVKASFRRVFQKSSEATAGNKWNTVVERLITELPRVTASLEYITAVFLTRRKCVEVNFTPILFPVRNTTQQIMCDMWLIKVIHWKWAEMWLTVVFCERAYLVLFVWRWGSWKMSWTRFKEWRNFKSTSTSWITCF